MPEMVLVCEGSASSTEVRVIQQLLMGPRLSLDVVVRGCGGEAGLGAVANYISATESISTVAYVRDRDYRPLERAEQSFIDRTPQFIWRRHEFENYLLEPSVVSAATHALGPSATDLPTDEREVREALRRCAQRYAPAEAGRMTLWAVRAEIDGDAPAQLGLPSIWSPGGAPLGEEECAQAVRCECERVCTESATRAKHPAVQPDAAEERYRATLARLRDHTYLDQELYLRDFGGRELFSGFWERLGGRRPAGLTTDLFCEELGKAISLLYETTDDLFQPDDFRDLAEGIRALAALDPA